MTYTISEFAEKIGITVHTLRYYEKEQLLHPHRANNNHRAYTDIDVRWMESILRLKETHMPIKQIKQYAAYYAQGNATLVERKEMLVAHQRRLEATIQKWQAHYQKLQEKIVNYEVMCAQVKKDMLAAGAIKLERE